MRDKAVLTRARHIIERLRHMLLARVQLRGCHLGRNVQTTGRVTVEGDGQVEIARRSKLLGGLVPTRLIARPGAVLRFGEYCMVNYGAYIEAHERVEIGHRCMLGCNVTISDADGDDRGAVIIEDDVWLAHGVVVRPGAHIGRGAVVSAGTVVKGDVPPETLLVGEPPRALPLQLVDPQ